MEYILLKEHIIDAIKNVILHLKNQGYWKSIISFSLYTDEDCMTLSFIFNTDEHLKLMDNDPYYLTYKFSPAEWYSETVKDDPIIKNNKFFAEISKSLYTYVMKKKTDIDTHRDKFEETCISSLKYCISTNAFEKQDAFYLFMMSDVYDKEPILKWNKEINSPEIVAELTKWLEMEEMDELDEMDE